MLRLFATLILLAMPALSAPVLAGEEVRARLSSPNASEEASGTLTLDGYNLAGHLTGGGIDVTITGTVKSSSVSVVVTGRIVPNCSPHNQSMSGVAQNEGDNTSVEMTFQCVKAYVGGDYLFRLNLRLPSNHLQVPGSDSGESAANDLSLGEIHRDLA